MLKNIIIIILSIILILFWLAAEPEEYDNLDDVVIEYKCSELDEYDSIPKEVVQECRDRRARLQNKT
jgi:hypothetical protein